MSKPLIIHRPASKGARVRAFLALARQKRETFHRSETQSGARRLVEFLRIARGRTV